MRVMRWLGYALLGLVGLILVGWVGITLWARGQAGDVPLTELAMVVAREVVSQVDCAVTGCPAELAPGLSSSVFDETLIASCPVALDVDEQGRVLVAEADRIWGGVEDNRFHPYWLDDDLASSSVADRRAYYEKWVPLQEDLAPDHFTARSDKLVMLEDRDGDGVADHRSDLAEFNDWTDGPIAGVLAAEGDIWVTEIPSVYRIRDADHEGVAETKDVLATGFGVKTSLLGHDMHGLVQGPDGRIYFSIGDRGYDVTSQEGRRFVPPIDPGRGAVFRMNPDGSGLEVFAEGVRNPQELAFDDHGNLFTGDNNGDGGDRARIVYVVEGGDSGWMMPYQTLVGDYVRGQWMAERLWEKAHEGQPAWVMPPVGYLGNGPAGFAAYPGTGLTDDYRGHFFMCDYGYTLGRSGVWTFRVEPDGAGFRMVDDEHFAWSMLATDFDFAWDGRMFVSLFSQLSQEQSIVALRHEASASDPRVAEVEALAREGMGARGVAELVALLRHDDRRIRLRAQFELARREESAALGAVARDPEAPTLARLHGLWGLGQLGAPGLQAAGIEDLAWLEAAPEEVRAQAAKIAGEADGVWLADDLMAMAASDTPRVRFFAAQSLGRLRYAPAIPLLAELLRENDERDVFLRHAALFALYRIGDLDAVLPLADDPDASVRLGALIVLRRAADPRVARFLDDEDPFLVVEAARAIHDVPIPQAMPALAALAGAVPPPNADDPQSGHALLRRVIQANVILGGESGALKLAALAESPEQPERMRRMALEALGSYAAPPPRDVALGAWRPLEERDPSVVYAAWDAFGTALAKGDLGDRALELATAAGRTPLSDDELLAEVRNDALGEPRRVAALGALAGRAEMPAGILDEAIAAALASDSPALRAEARDVLAVVRPAEALAVLAALDAEAPLAERQRVFATLTGIEGAEAEARLAAAMDALEAGELDAGVQLDAMAAIRAREGALAERLAAWQAATANGDLVESRSWALAGGDPLAGEAIFQGNGDCLRCHGAEAGHGGGVGPPLEGIAGREDAGYLLESVLDPGARIVPGFATVSVTTSEGVTHTGTLLEDQNGALLLATGDGEVRVDAGAIASQTPPASAMPPMGLTLPPHELRDLIAYLGTL